MPSKASCDKRSDRLRTILSRRGLSLPAATLTAYLTSQSLIKSPSTLAAPATTTPLATHLARSLSIAKWKAIALATAATATLATITTATVLLLHNATPIAPQVPSRPASFPVTDDGSADVSTLPARSQRSPLLQRYNKIFQQMNEKLAGDRYILEIARSAKPDPAHDPAIQQRIHQEQIRWTASCWNHVEAALRTIAPRHGLSLNPLDQAPKLPTDLSTRVFGVFRG